MHVLLACGASLLTVEAGHFNPFCRQQPSDQTLVVPNKRLDRFRRRGFSQLKVKNVSNNRKIGWNVCPSRQIEISIGAYDTMQCNQCPCFSWKELQASLAKHEWK